MAHKLVGTKGFGKDFALASKTVGRMAAAKVAKRVNHWELPRADWKVA